MTRGVEILLEYDEPGDDGENVTVQVSWEDAIAQMRTAAARHNYYYSYDSDALLDFIVVHWARMAVIE